MIEFGRWSFTQAAPDVAAAEEVLVPMDDSILAGPAIPAIAFRDLAVTWHYHLAGVIEFEKVERSRRDAGATKTSDALDQLRPAVRAGAG
jgi:hypothetical protein